MQPHNQVEWNCCFTVKIQILFKRSVPFPAVAPSLVLHNYPEEILELIYEGWENLISFIFLEISGTFSLWDGLKKCGVVSLELEWDSCAPLPWVSSVGLLPCSGSLPFILGTLNKWASNSFYVAYYLLIVCLSNPH